MSSDFVPHASGPSRIGRYERIGKLATGGMAELLLACVRGEGGFERPVVIKRILPHLAEREDFTAMFMDEARIAASIRHPNVVRVEALEKDEDGPYLVMEYLEGESGANLMRRLSARGLKLEPALAAHVVAEACAGLHAAHESTDADGQRLGLVHRDVSPENVFLTYDGGVKVVDFGIAKAADRIAQTEAGQIKGKFRYMSPEQIEGAPLDRRSDIFALGIVLFELSTGHRLFARGTRAATMRAVMDAPIAPPSMLNASVPEALDAIAVRALSRDPEARYATAADMRRDLHRLLHEIGSADAPPSERLGNLMVNLFADRVRDKRGMLRLIREGAEVGELPSAEVDITVELPTAATAMAPTPKLPPEPAPARRSAAGWLLGGIAALTLLGVAGVAAWAVLSDTPEAIEPHAVIDREAAPAPPPQPPAPVRPAEVTVRVESEPDGAAVTIDGSSRGVTPVDVTIPRSGTRATLRLEADGYEALEDGFVPDVDQRLRFTLDAVEDPAPARRRRAHPRPRPRPPADEASPPSFERFD